MRFSEVLEVFRPALDLALAELPSGAASAARWMMEDEELHRLGGAVMGHVAQAVLHRMDPEAMRVWEEVRAAMADSVAGGSMNSVLGDDERFHIRTFFGTQDDLISRIIGSRSRHREHGLTNRMKRSSEIPVKDSCVMPAMYEMV